MGAGSLQLGTRGRRGACAKATTRHTGGSGTSDGNVSDADGRDGSSRSRERAIGRGKSVGGSAGSKRASASRRTASGGGRSASRGNTAIRDRPNYGSPTATTGRAAAQI